MPVNGLEMANQSGIASLKGSELRLRMRKRALANGRSVERPEESCGMNPSGELIVFTLSSYR